MNDKNILTELVTFCASLQEGSNKKELQYIIIQMTSGKINLKTVLQLISKKIIFLKSPLNKNVTMREKNIKIWEYILDLFIKNLKGSSK